SVGIDSKHATEIRTAAAADRSIQHPAVQDQLSIRLRAVRVVARKIRQNLVIATIGVDFEHSAVADGTSAGGCAVKRVARNNQIAVGVRSIRKPCETPYQ